MNEPVAFNKYVCINVCMYKYVIKACYHSHFVCH